MSFVWRCFLDGVQVDEPIDMDQLQLSIIRDESLHGIGAEASTSALTFKGNGASYIENIKTTIGLRANIVFEAEANCGDDSDVFDSFVKGKVNLGTYKKTCGEIGCQVSVAIESVTCETILHNRYDQKVDVDKPVGFDGITALPQYSDLGIILTLPAQSLQLIDKASNTNPNTEVISDQPGWASNVTGDGFNGYVIPRYENTDYSALGSFNIGSFQELFAGGANNTPDLDNSHLPITVNAEEILGNIKCDLTNTVLNMRWHGKAELVTAGAGLSLKYKIFYLPKDADPNIIANWVTLYNATIGVDVGDQDISTSMSLTLNQGDWLVIGIFVLVPTGFSDISKFTLTQYPETFLEIKTQSLCQPSEADLYAVHETLSRVTEAITDGCVRVKSSYYGRTDSQPFDFPSDGCGGLRTLTSGLKIRNALNATFFASLQDLIEGLQDIDNIGMGVEPDPDKGDNYLVLRVEDLDYFYQDKEIMRCDFIAEGEFNIETTKSYSLIEVGYKKWQIINTNGLDEFNSAREYRTSLSSLSTKLDITSALIAGGYPLEITRQQSFAATGAADTTYDNEIFIICLKRLGVYGYPYGGMVVEQGNIDSASNILDPSTIYNYRLSPVRNLMRWFRSIAASYPNVTDSENNLIFGSGVGNILASGRLREPDLCALENMVISENQNIFVTQFKDAAKATPLWRNETFTYDYPMSIKDYKSIKANPYGYISYQCGNGEWEQGWIKELKYQPVKGISTIILRKRWS